jgi:hypothetical protein
MNTPQFKDLYPLRYKNYINSKMTKNKAVLIIQKAWRNYIFKKNMEHVPSRFASWFMW